MERSVGYGNLRIVQRISGPRRTPRCGVFVPLWIERAALTAVSLFY